MRAMEQVDRFHAAAKPAAQPSAQPWGCRGLIAQNQCPLLFFLRDAAVGQRLADALELI